MKTAEKITHIYNRYREPVLYIIFGGLTTVLSVAVYAAFTELFSWDELLANVISWIIAVMFAFITNRIWVFHSEEKGIIPVIRQMMAFGSGRVATLIIEELILWVFVKQLAFNGLVIKIVAQVLVIVLNYVISKIWIFKKKSE